MGRTPLRWLLKAPPLLLLPHYTQSHCRAGWCLTRGDGADIDNSPSTLFLHNREDTTTTGIYCLQFRYHAGFQLLRVHCKIRLERHGYRASVVDQTIETAPPIDDCLDHPLNLTPVSHICLIGDGSSARCFYIGDHLLSGLTTAVVVHDNCRPVLRK